MGVQEHMTFLRRENLEAQKTLMLTGRRLLAGVEPNRAAASWAERVPVLEHAVNAKQGEIALRSAVAASVLLAEQGEHIPGEGVINTKAFGDVVFGDKPLNKVLRAPGKIYEAGIIGGLSPFQAQQKAQQSLDRLLKTIAADTARGAMGTAVAVREGVGYVRMTTPPSCPDCIVLAGRFYPWNKGFQRHPKCDCVHVPTTAKDFAGAVERGLLHDPYELFHSMSEEEQDRIFGFGNAQAIRDGADIFQVINSKRARRGDFTLEGLGKHGNARLSHPGLSRYGRLTPEAIYARAESREQAVRWLRANGYILDAGQVPTGALRGQRLGFGEHGHGGKWLGGRNAEIIRALNSGVRDPGEIGTLTAAEQRMFIASRDLELVRQGVHPYSESALARRGAPRIGGAELELTPEVAARFERHYYITMHARGEALEMKRLQRLVPGKPLSAVDTAEVYAHHAARKVVVAEQSIQARAAREAIEETKRTTTGSPKPLAGGKGGGVKPPASRLTEGVPDEPWDAEFYRQADWETRSTNINIELSEVLVKDNTFDVFWNGVGKHGGHSFDAPIGQKPKNRFPKTWTLNDYVSATKLTITEPEYVHYVGNEQIRLIRVVKDVVLEVTLVRAGESGKLLLKHSVPVYGRGVMTAHPSGDLSPSRAKVPWYRVLKVERGRD